MWLLKIKISSTYGLILFPKKGEGKKRGGKWKMKKIIKYWIYFSQTVNLLLHKPR